jgi:hypothetical protein
MMQEKVAKTKRQFEPDFPDAVMSDDRKMRVRKTILINFKKLGDHLLN